MRIKTLLLTLGVLLPGGVVLAVVTPQSLPCTNDFDGSPDGTSVTTLTGVGWDASSNSVVVQRGVISPVVPNVGAVLIPKRMVVSNSVRHGA